MAGLIWCPATPIQQPGELFERPVGGSQTGQHTAQAMIYNQLNQQAGAMAYQDIFRLLCWMAVIMIGFAFLLRKNRPGQGTPAGEAVH